MRNPSRKAVIFAGLALFGVALTLFGIERHETIGKDWVSGLIIATGGLTAFGSVLWLLMSLLHMRGMAKLEAGLGRVAQWHVNAADWDKYRAADAVRVASDPHFLVNDLWIRKTTPPEGVDVIVGEKSLIVDGSYHVLRVHGMPGLCSIGWLDNSRAPGRPPDCLEFLLVYPRGRGSTQYTCLRVPVPEAARVQGRQAYHHFAPQLERRRAIALRNPRRTLQICGAVLVASLASLAWGWIEAQRTDWNTYDTETPIILLTVGGVGTIFALVLGGLTWFMRPKPSS